MDRELNKSKMFYENFIICGFVFGIMVRIGTSSHIAKVAGDTGGETVEELRIGADLRRLSFPDDYHAIGFLSLPTSNISEPIEVWYSKFNEQSRIDYYHGR